VCYNDTDALAARAFLREQPASHVRHITVVGFDNSVNAFAEELTSYDFNSAGIARAMFEWLTAPARFARAWPHTTVNISGRVVER
jgi:DNA-binding LacI/PurR family transcriptional regulator